MEEDDPDRDVPLRHVRRRHRLRVHRLDHQGAVRYFPHVAGHARPMGGAGPPLRRAHASGLRAARGTRSTCARPWIGQTGCASRSPAWRRAAAERKRYGASGRWKARTDERTESSSGPRPRSEGDPSVLAKEVRVVVAAAALGADLYPVGGRPAGGGGIRPGHDEPSIWRTATIQAFTPSEAIVGVAYPGIVSSTGCGLPRGEALDLDHVVRAVALDDAQDRARVEADRRRIRRRRWCPAHGGSTTRAARRSDARTAPACRQCGSGRSCPPRRPPCPSACRSHWSRSRCGRGSRARRSRGR